MSLDTLPNDVPLSRIPGMFDRDDDEHVSVSLSPDEIDLILERLVFYRVKVAGLTVQQRQESRKLESYLERMGS